MKHNFTHHFKETLKRRYGIELTNSIKDKLIANIDKAKPYKQELKGRSPSRVVYLGDILYEYITVAYDPKTQTFVSALRIGFQ